MKTLTSKIMTIKRLLGGLCLLVGIAIATSQTANAWQIQNNYEEGMGIWCGNCAFFGFFYQKPVALHEIVYCDGAEAGCRGDSAADGYGAQLNIDYYGHFMENCSFVIPDHIKPQGKIVFNKLSYTVWDNESDLFPTKFAQPYPKNGICRS